MANVEPLATQKQKGVPFFDGWRAGEQVAPDRWMLTHNLAVPNYQQD
jgi:hypothetical protein